MLAASSHGDVDACSYVVDACSYVVDACRNVVDACSYVVDVCSYVVSNVKRLLSMSESGPSLSRPGSEPLRPRRPLVQTSSSSEICIMTVNPHAGCRGMGVDGGIEDEGEG
jgi:hypothetical protein